MEIDALILKLVSMRENTQELSELDGSGRVQD